MNKRLCGIALAVIFTGILAARAPLCSAAAPAARKPPIFVDEKGKVLPLPVDPATGLIEIEKIRATGKLKKALEKTELLLAHPDLAEAQRRDLLYGKANLLFRLYADNPGRYLTTIVDAGIMAMSRSPDDPRNGEVCLHLGYANLKAGNIPEARGYFAQMQKNYPRDENIPLIHYYWGEWHYERRELREAVAEFERVLDLYPRSRAAGASAIGLAMALGNLGEHRKAGDVIAYLETTWPRAYLDRPGILQLAGDAAFRRRDYALAVEKYMLGYNLEPRGAHAAELLTKIGDAHARAGRMTAAEKAYRKAASSFPGTDGGNVGLMRLTELDPEDAGGISGIFSSFPGDFSEYPGKAPSPAPFSLGNATVLALQDTPGSMDAARFSGLDAQTIHGLEPGGKAASSATVYLVRSGGKNILIDTGFGGNGPDRKSMLFPLLEEAGVSPRDIDTVLLTHLRLDHAGGLLRDGIIAFPSALVWVSRPELAFWTDAGLVSAAPGLRKNFTLVQAITKAYGARLRTFTPNATVAPDIMAIAAPGHTPGHTAFLLATGQERLLFIGDTVQAASLQFPHPEIYAGHDKDGVSAARSRALLLGLAGAENIPIAGAHLPFPGIGHVASSGSGYAFSPGL